MLYKTRGIIIKKSNLGEFDQLITVYTKEFGKIVLRGKSVRKNKAKLKGCLDLFLKSFLMIAPGKGFDIITGAEIEENFSYIRSDLSALSACFYLSELINRLIPELEKDENVWRLVLVCFEGINNKSDIVQTVSFFESELLNILGYGQNKKNKIDFIQSLLNSKINSRVFYKKSLI